jgi:anhydro-N-acetylmuramic acid kinase
MTRVIGLISGTSIDGIDAALVDITGATRDLKVDLIAGATYDYPADLRSQILAVCGGAPLSLADLADLDDAIAQQFAQAALRIQQGHSPADWIGSHGQTVFHRAPRGGEQGGRGEIALGYSLQLGRGETIAALTQISTISNFRVADIAAGGHGAPLVPPVDVALLSHPTLDRCIQNIGGIGNVAYLPARSKNQPHSPTPPLATLGWDTGPGNLLLDLAVHQLSDRQQSYDAGGAWAASGTPCLDLVDRWLQQDYFQQPPPKSTGRELFGQAYLDRCMGEFQHLTGGAVADHAADFLATLTDFTAASIAHSYETFLPQLPDQVLLCGGGSKNDYLKQRLQIRLREIPVLLTDQVGLNADYKEAIAFAVLAYWRQQGIPGNLPAVTGAVAPVLLGEIHAVQVFCRDSMGYREANQNQRF